jgi:hypothetical protein
VPLLVLDWQLSLQLEGGTYAVLDDAAFVEVVIMVVIHGALPSYVQNVATNG